MSRRTSGVTTTDMPYPRLAPHLGPDLPREAIVFLMERHIVPVPLRQWEAQRSTVGELVMLLGALRNGPGSPERHRAVQLINSLDRLFGLLPELPEVG